MKAENEIAYDVIGMAIEIHRTLGPGLFESVYENCLAYEGRMKGYEVAQQVAVPLKYKEVKLDAGFRIDLCFNQIVLVEL